MSTTETIAKFGIGKELLFTSDDRVGEEQVEEDKKSYCDFLTSLNRRTGAAKVKGTKTLGKCLVGVE